MLQGDDQSARLVGGKYSDGRAKHPYEFDLAPFDIDGCAAIHFNSDLFFIEFDLRVFVLFEKRTGFFVRLFARNEDQGAD